MPPAHVFRSGRQCSAYPVALSRLPVHCGVSWRTGTVHSGVGVHAQRSLLEPSSSSAADTVRTDYDAERARLYSLHLIGLNAEPRFPASDPPPRATPPIIRATARVAGYFALTAELAGRSTSALRVRKR